jgi:hypothetical protein
MDVIPHTATPLWTVCSTPSYIDPDTADNAIQLLKQAPSWWKTTIHGQALTLATGLDIPYTPPVCDPPQRQRITKQLTIDPTYAKNDLQNYPNSDPLLHPIWTRLGAEGRQTLLMPAVTPSQASIVAHTIAMDKVTCWPRPSNERINHFVHTIQHCDHTASKETRDHMAEAARMWVDIVFEPHTSPRKTSARQNNQQKTRTAKHIFGQACHTPLGATPTAICDTLTVVASREPYSFHLHPNHQPTTK